MYNNIIFTCIYIGNTGFFTVLRKKDGINQLNKINKKLKTLTVGKAFGYDPRKNPAKITPVLLYMLAHAAACVGLVLLSPFFWHHFWAHTALVSILIACSVWNGSRRYYYMMTQSYERKLRALLPEEKREWSGGGGGSGGGREKRE